MREFKLEEHEAKPIRIREVGITPRPDTETGYLIWFLVDVNDRNDILKAIEAHRSATEGDFTMAWFATEGSDTEFNLLVELERPVPTKFILPFDRVRHGNIVDLLVDGDSFISLIPGDEEDRLEDLMHASPAGLTLQVTAIVPRDPWEKLWRQALMKQLNISDEEASRIVRLEQTELRLRSNFPDMPPLDRLAGMFLDTDEHRLVVITNEILKNRLRRDGPKVVDSFDRYFDDEVNELSNVVSQVAADVIPALIAASKSGDSLRWHCGQLIGNALGTIVAAVELVRLGHRLQPGILLRSAIEMACVAAHLFQRPDDLGRYLAGKLDSSRAVNEAKNMVPSIGGLYGHLTNMYTHVSFLHMEVQESQEYDSADDAAAKTNLMSIHLSLLNLWIITELVFFDSVTLARFWRQATPGQFAFEPSAGFASHISRLTERLSTESASA